MNHKDFPSSSDFHFSSFLNNAPFTKNEGELQNKIKRKVRDEVLFYKVNFCFINFTKEFELFVLFNW